MHIRACFIKDKVAKFYTVADLSADLDKGSL